MQFPAGSPSNPPEDDAREVSKYPQKTPYVILKQVSPLERAGCAGLMEASQTRKWNLPTINNSPLKLAAHHA